MASNDTDIPQQDLDRITRLLRTYFDHDPLNRFDLERFVGNGANSIAWKIKYKPKAEAALERIVLKMERYVAYYDDDAPEPMDAVYPTPSPDNSARETKGGDEYDEATMWSRPIKNEERWLKLLNWAKHIVGIYEIPGDPLRRKIPGVRSHHGDDWLYLEWIENGSLEDFVKRANTEDYARLPNRLLWRFFMCLVRMCIAMAWPPERTPDNSRVLEHVRTSQPRALAHNDIHDGNVMIGPFGDDPDEPEHDIAPMLKLIDFGSGGLTEGDNGGEDTSAAIQENLQSIGTIMTMLATLNTETDTSTASFTRRRGGRRIQTYASEVLPDANGEDPCPDLDRSLRTLICLCRATDPANIPTISSLATLVHDAIEARDANYYGGDEVEKDDIILTMLGMLLVNGPVQ